MNVFKAILVLGMVLSHGISLLSPSIGPFEPLSQIIALITFSGFFFCFGYVYNLAYGGKDVASGKKVRSVILPLLAYYISALSWVVIKESDLSLLTLAKVITTYRLPPFSEFLLAFSLMSLVYWLIKPTIDTVKNKPYFTLILVFLLVSSFVPFYRFYPVVQLQGKEIVFDAIIGLFFGSPKAYFPIVQYSFFFFMGILFSERQIVFDSKVLLACIAGTAACFIYWWTSGQLPSRFPPNFLWITGSWLFIYLYYLASKKLRWLQNLATVTIGENTLNYLVLSNILLFSLSEIGYRSYSFAILSSILVVMVITFLIDCTRKPMLR